MLLTIELQKAPRHIYSIDLRHFYKEEIALFFSSYISLSISGYRVEYACLNYLKHYLSSK